MSAPGKAGTSSREAMATSIWAAVGSLVVIFCSQRPGAVRTRMIALGGLLGAVLTVYQVHFPVGWAGMTIFGLFSGVFVGCLAMALAESLKVIPVLCQRLNMKTGLPIVITALALGKMAGSFVQLMFWRI